MVSKKELFELRRFLRSQDCLRVPQDAYDYAEAYQNKDHGLFYIVVDIFNYGYIMGQRFERARRKGGAKR